jgi:putative ABC transport system permease protein
MFKPYFLITLRNLIRDKSFLILNVLGLTLGIAGSILILLYVRHEISFEKFHPKADRIYRINIYGKMEGKEISAAITAPPQAKAFKAEFPEIEDATRFYYPMDQKVTVNNVTYHEKKFFYADQNFLQIFNFPLEAGNIKTALEKPFSVILTPETAIRLFGNLDVLGKNIVLNNDKVYQVTGLTGKIPGNTHFQFDFLASFSSHELSSSEFWLSQMLETYILLQENYSYKELESKFEMLLDKYVIPQIKMLIPIKIDNYKEFEAMGNVFRFTLQPLQEIHFTTEYLLGYGQSTDRIYVYFFSIVAIFLLFIACINFMNLSTARYANRSKEVGVKKVLGSARNQLIRQFLLESFLITLISVIIALTLIELIIPAFNNFTGKSLGIGYLSSWYVIPGIILLVLVITILSGLYPAYYLSSFQPVDTLKSKFQGGNGNIKLRSVLVVLQFTITIMLLIGTFVVSSQLRYVRNKNLGFNKENVMVVKNTGDLGEGSEAFRQEVLKTRGVENASRSWTYPGDLYFGSTYQMEGDSTNKMYHFEVIHGDYEFIPTLGIQITEGRNFSPDFSTDTAAILINQRAVDFLGLKQPVGSRLTTPNAKGGFDLIEIIGVFKDVHYKSLHERVEPTMLGLNTSRSNAYTIIKLSETDMIQTIRKIESIWKEFLPGQAFEYTFVDKNFETLYKAEKRASQIFTIFAILAVFVACLGLLGLSAFAVAKRTKEIGVRKVHGASVAIILSILSKEILILIMISSVIAWPAVYMIMNKWLEQFAYKTNINPLIFVVSTLIALIIAISVVIYQSMKTARINPVEALKTD